MDDLGLIALHAALISGTLANEMHRQGLLSPEARSGITASLRGMAEKLDLMDEPNPASVHLNTLANALLREP